MSLFRGLTVCFQLVFDMLVLQKHNTEMTTAAGEAFYTLVCLHQVLDLPPAAPSGSGAASHGRGPASPRRVCLALWLLSARPCLPSLRARLALSVFCVGVSLTSCSAAVVSLFTAVNQYVDRCPEKLVLKQLCCPRRQRRPDDGDRASGLEELTVLLGTPGESSCQTEGAAVRCGQHWVEGRPAGGPEPLHTKRHSLAALLLVLCPSPLWRHLRPPASQVGASLRAQGVGWGGLLFG